MTIKVAICDDEPRICEELEYSICSEAGSCAKVLISHFYSGESFLSVIQKGEKFDLVFLDINLVNVDGTVIGHYIRDVRNDYKTELVFISSQSSYAIKLFELSPLDFLIKPIDTKQIFQVLQKYKIRHSEPINYSFSNHGEISFIDFDEIMYFQSLGRKIRIKGIQGDEEFYGRLDHVYNELPTGFLRIHKSYIVNLSFIKCISYKEIILKNNETISISKSYRNEVRDRMLKIMNKRIL